MQEAILSPIAPKISFGKMTISENGKEPCPYQFMYTMD
jgi:hypothetical protein